MLSKHRMSIRVKGARENNLKSVDVEFQPGLTVVTGVSGSGKTSLVFETLYHEARRRFEEIFQFGSVGQRLSPAQVDSVTGIGPAIAVSIFVACRGLFFSDGSSRRKSENNIFN